LSAFVRDNVERLPENEKVSPEDEGRREPSRFLKSDVETALNILSEKEMKG